MSLALVIARAASSVRSELGPAESGSLAAPGTAKSGRPCRAAWLAVMSEPEPAVARTTTTAEESPLMVRLRRGKLRLSASTGRKIRSTTAPRRR